MRVCVCYRVGVQMKENTWECREYVFCSDSDFLCVRVCVCVREMNSFVSYYPIITWSSNNMLLPPLWLRRSQPQAQETERYQSQPGYLLFESNKRLVDLASLYSCGLEHVWSFTCSCEVRQTLECCTQHISHNSRCAKLSDLCVHIAPPTWSREILVRLWPLNGGVGRYIWVENDNHVNSRNDVLGFAKSSIVSFAVSELFSICADHDC